MELEVSPFSEVVTKRLKSWEPGTLVSRFHDGQRRFYLVGIAGEKYSHLYVTGSTKIAMNLQTGLSITDDNIEFEECQGKVNIVAEWNE